MADLIADCVLAPGRYVKLQIWTRSDGEDTWTVYKLPDGTEYRGDVYGLVDGAE